MKTPDCGHFSKDGLEYVVTRPDTPRPFDNMLWNRQLLGNVQQTGAGYTDYQIGSFEMTKLSQGIGRICDFDVYGRDTFLNRLVYVRDNKTGKFWNVGWEPPSASSSPPATSPRSTGRSGSGPCRSRRSQAASLKPQVPATRDL